MTPRFRSYAAVSVVLSALMGACNPGTTKESFDASGRAVTLDQQIDWSQARLITVQDGNRYKTLDSFARESITGMYGREHFPELSPMASLMECLFNREAYADTPIVRIKDRGVQIHLSAHFPEVIRRRIQSTGYMTPNEMKDSMVESRIRELEPLAPMRTAIGRVRDAQFITQGLDQLAKIVPAPEGSRETAWHSPNELAANLPADLRLNLMSSFPGRFDSFAPIAGVSESEATAILGKWSALEIGWQSGDAGRVQAALDGLAEILPTFAAAGVYPTESQRSAEASYYAWGKFTWGYWIYALGALVSVWSLVTGWRAPRNIAIILLLIAMGLHAYGIGLRWYILGRIPVANMFEAVVGAAWGAIAIGLILELVYKSRVFIFGCHMTGFLALVLGSFVIPGGGTLTSIMGILDDIMLRIHTVLIILSYGLIFLGGMIAVIYLFGYYFRSHPALSAQVGVTTSMAGAVTWAIAARIFQADGGDLSGFVKNELAARGFVWAAAAAALLLVFTWRRSGAIYLTLLVNLLIMCLTLGFGDHAFATGMALSIAAIGLFWAVANWFGMRLNQGFVRSADRAILAGAGGLVDLPLEISRAEAHALRVDRPILAGGAPGDEGGAKALPAWLTHFDWCHLIILNIVFIILFVGIILGAVWADYSWGRPWGWDPKEVFAMNTWIIYAILLHVRFFVKQRGLWTAWLSVAGCLMMAFNWCFVNFFIVGLHSYA